MLYKCKANSTLYFSDLFICMNSINLQNLSKWPKMQSKYRYILIVDAFKKYLHSLII